MARNVRTAGQVKVRDMLVIQQIPYVVTVAYRHADDWLDLVTIGLEGLTDTLNIPADYPVEGFFNDEA